MLLLFQAANFFRYLSFSDYKTYVITDACGNSATVTHTISVDDNTAPVITGTIAPITIEGCTSADAPAPLTTVALLETAGVTITDACTADLTWWLFFTNFFRYLSFSNYKNLCDH